MKSCENLSFDVLKRLIADNMESKRQATQEPYSKECLLEIISNLSEKQIKEGFLKKLFSDFSGLSLSEILPPAFHYRSLNDMLDNQIDPDVLIALLKKLQPEDRDKLLYSYVKELRSISHRDTGLEAIAFRQTYEVLSYLLKNVSFFSLAKGIFNHRLDQREHLEDYDISHLESGIYRMAPMTKEQLNQVNNEFKLIARYIKHPNNIDIWRMAFPEFVDRRLEQLHENMRLASEDKPSESKSNALIIDYIKKEYKDWDKLLTIGISDTINQLFKSELYALKVKIAVRNDDINAEFKSLANMYNNKGLSLLKLTKDETYLLALRLYASFEEFSPALTEAQCKVKALVYLYEEEEHDRDAKMFINYASDPEKFSNYKLNDPNDNKGDEKKDTLEIDKNAFRYHLIDLFEEILFDLVNKTDTAVLKNKAFSIHTHAALRYLSSVDLRVEASIEGVGKALFTLAGNMKNNEKYIKYICDLQLIFNCMTTHFISELKQTSEVFSRESKYDLKDGGALSLDDSEADMSQDSNEPHRSTLMCYSVFSHKEADRPIDEVLNELINTIRGDLQNKSLDTEEAKSYSQEVKKEVEKILDKIAYIQDAKGINDVLPDIRKLIGRLPYQKNATNYKNLQDLLTKLLEVLPKMIDPENHNRLNWSS